ncbi:DUF4124 domain-containing protein [Methylotenera sp. G11]|uniref:DUF4124 domain-containing protein n=1 Tax=Methylotenera sp. G11 TaxID=1506585 RepID=UPI00069029EC|nr:DUF4124 domain-containing protein [Methylotenera sp. G11]
MMLQLQRSTSGKPDYFASVRLTIIASLVSATCFMPHAQAEGSGRIVKWKDEKGITHYGDSIPPQYADRDNSLMNKQGITVQHNKPNAPQVDQAAESAKLEQNKKDRALLGTFTNANEIDLTRDRNLEPELLALKNLQQDRAVAQKKLEQSDLAASNYSKAKKPVPANIRDELKTHKDAVTKIDQRISERQQAIDSIQKRFDDDKKRYLALRGQNTATATGSQNPPNQ